MCCTFSVVSYADRCSDLCNECKKSPSDLSTCCQAENACYENKVQKCKAAIDSCKSLEGVGGDGDDYGNNQYRPVFDRDIWNYQQNFQNPPQHGFRS
jgi:hypothetical protein